MCRPTSNFVEQLPSASKTWPTRSAGPDLVTYPLSKKLLRLVLGNPRTNTFPLRWFSSHQRYALSHSTLQVSLDGRSTSINLSPAPGQDSNTTAIPDQWIDLLPSNDKDWFISLTLTSDDGSRFTATMVADHFAPMKGILEIPLLSNGGIPVAVIIIDYICITPHPRAARGVRNSMFTPRFTGHRGMGSSGPKAPWRVLENSAESFLMAALADTEVKAVELDVQLTRDGKAVVYHDWFFRPRDSKGHPIYDRNVVKVPPYNATFDQFDKLYRESFFRFEEGIDKKRQACRELAKKRGDVPDSAFEIRAKTLREICEELPQDIGLLVEVKYPAPNVQDDEIIPYPEKNEYADIVLNDLVNVEKNYGRNIAFLTFDADLCMMLALKQRQFPVFLSHCEALDKPCDEFDPRMIDVIEGLRFVLSQQLDGMMLFNEIVRQKPEAIATIVARGIPILTYGASNSDRDVVKHQFSIGVTGVIADDVDELVSSLYRK